MVPFLAASLAVQAALLGGIALLRGKAAGERLVEVKILPLRSPARTGAAAPAPPAPPPARVARAPRRNTEKTHVTPLIPPKVLPEERPLPPPEPPPDSSSEDDSVELGGGPGGGTEGGVSGGIPGGVVGGIGGSDVSGSGRLMPVPPIPARPRDMEAVRERIARTVRYPRRAKDLGWEGRCLVEFVLLADGAIRHLHVMESSGRPLLDEAALAAVRGGAPFPPPGVDVLVRTPIAFRLH
jgi:protein TonB